MTQPRFTIRQVGEGLAYIMETLDGETDVRRLVDTRISGEDVMAAAGVLAERLIRSNGALHTLED